MLSKNFFREGGGRGEGGMGWDGVGSTKNNLFMAAIVAPGHFQEN